MKQPQPVVVRVPSPTGEGVARFDDARQRLAFFCELDQAGAIPWSVGSAPDSSPLVVLKNANHARLLDARLQVWRVGHANGFPAGGPAQVTRAPWTHPAVDRHQSRAQRTGVSLMEQAFLCWVSMPILGWLRPAPLRRTRP